MKFLIAVALLALAVGVQSSLIAAGPWGAPWGGAAWGAPWGHVAVDNSAWAGPVVGAWGAGHGAWGAGHGVWGAHAGIPGIALAQGPGLAHGVHGPGVYVAKTRGAVHTAPLAGHIASATSVNVAPAPGTH